MKWRLEVISYDLVRAVMMLFPFNGISKFGGALFRFIGPKTSKQKIVLTGLRTAFPNMPEADIVKTAKAQWDNTGRTFFEFPLLGRVKVFGKKSRVKIIGLDKIEALKTSEQGAVLVTGHFANWEIIAAAISQSGLPVRVTYRRLNNPYFDKRVAAQRRKYGIDLMTPKSGPRGARQLITALKNGQSVAIMNDQKFNEGIEVPFFNAPAMTAPGPVRMALKTGAPLIPMVARRNGADFEVEFYEPIKLEHTGDKQADILAGVKAVTAFIEARIIDNPDQWFWVHRRWAKSHYRK
ncbi:MAG: lysophospholipid acyltransferase family protein [Robiginitomaculum sp.]